MSDTRWKPGQSGNPGGRPRMDKEALEIRDLAREHARSAIQRAAEIMLSKDERVALAACDLILQRAYGRVVPIGTGIFAAPDVPSEDDGAELFSELSKDPDARKQLDRLAATAARLAGDAGILR